MSTYTPIGAAQNPRCALITDINESFTRVAVNLTDQDHVCLRCLNVNGETSLQTSWVLHDGSIVSDRENQNPTLGDYLNGMLVLLPGVLENGIAGEYGTISCFSGDDIAPGYAILDVTLFSTSE